MYQKRSLRRGDVISVLKYKTFAEKRNYISLPAVARTRINELKLKQKIFELHIRNNFLIAKTAIPWDRQTGRL